MAQVLRKPKLLDLVVDAIHASGWDVLLLSARNGHPFRLSVFKGDTRLTLVIYIWNLTHGGYPRDPNEFRIQVTGVDFIASEPDSRTLLLGWSGDFEVFAGYDATKHQTSMSGRSPSIQIRKECLEKARDKGLCPYARDNNEIAIAFRPDYFIPYVLAATELHRTTAAMIESTVLTRITDDESERLDITGIAPVERRQVLQAVNRKIRDARFRTNVLRAYGYRCCVCDLQLDLLDAAHIIPVEHKRGTDELKNGLALCALHHRAFDHALITVQRDYGIACSEKALARLRNIGWDGGEKGFRDALRDQITLPKRKEFYPSPDFLEFGQTLRGWVK